MPTQDEIDRRALADHRALVGRHIKATSVVCSDGMSVTDEFMFPEPLTLSIDADDGDVKRWTDGDHCDPWYYVTLVSAPEVCQAILARDEAHVVAVYGPSYHLNGKYEKPDWKVVANG